MSTYQRLDAIITTKDTNMDTESGTTGDHPTNNWKY